MIMGGLITLIVLLWVGIKFYCFYACIVIGFTIAIMPIILIANKLISLGEPKRN